LAETLAILQNFRPEELHDPRAAVYVALVLAETNELERAKDYIAAAESGKLYSDEKKLLQEAKAKLSDMSATASPTGSPSSSATPSPL
jgi:hypothetical protein